VYVDKILVNKLDQNMSEPSIFVVTLISNGIKRCMWSVRHHLQLASPFQYMQAGIAHSKTPSLRGIN